MTKHEHEMVYGQENDDFQKDAWQMKCTKCDYKSYMFGKPPTEAFDRSTGYIEHIDGSVELVELSIYSDNE